MPRWFLANPRSPFFREGEDTSLHPSVYRILRCSVGAVCRRIVWSSILLGESRPALQLSLFLIFLRTESSSSWVNGPSLMSNCLLIILVIDSCVTFSGFPSRFSKCCFHSFILSCWFIAFSFALTVLFLLLTSFIVCRAILDCLSSTESLILSIWFCIYSVCSFIYMPANWYCAVFSFKAFVFVGGIWRLFPCWRHLEAIFTCARFSLTDNVSHGILYLVLGFVGIHFAAASRCTLAKFSYSSFGVPFSVFSCRVSNMFLNSTTYLLLW